MIVTERTPEARLFQLYQRYVVDLVADVRKLDATYEPGDSPEVWPRPFAWEEFLQYLNGPVRSPSTRRSWLKRILRYGTPEDQAVLRVAFESILVETESSNRTTRHRTDAGSASKSLSSPHFDEKATRKK